MAESILGHLIPCSGGKAIALRQPKLFLGKRKAKLNQAAHQAAAVQHCELNYEDGCWTILRKGSPYPLKVNGQECDTARLQSGDLISLGPFRYRLRYPKSREEIEKLKALKAKAKADKHDATANQHFGQLLPMGGGTPISLHQIRMTIGRKEDCDIMLANKQISGLHCGLELINGHWKVVDLGSQNGIRVNGIPRKRKWLFPGDVLSIVSFRFQIQYIPEGDAPEDEEDQKISKSLLDKAGLKEKQIKTDPEEESGPDRINLFEH